MQRSDGESPLRVRSGEEGGVRVSFVKTSRLLEDLKAVAVSRAPHRGVAHLANLMDLDR